MTGYPQTPAKPSATLLALVVGSVLLASSPGFGGKPSWLQPIADAWNPPHKVATLLATTALFAEGSETSTLAAARALTGLKTQMAHTNAHWTTGNTSEHDQPTVNQLLVDDLSGLGPPPKSFSGAFHRLKALEQDLYQLSSGEVTPDGQVLTAVIRGHEEISRRAAATVELGRSIDGWVRQGVRSGIWRPRFSTFVDAGIAVLSSFAGARLAQCQTLEEFLSLATLLPAAFAFLAVEPHIRQRSREKRKPLDWQLAHQVDFMVDQLSQSSQGAGNRRRNPVGLVSYSARMQESFHDEVMHGATRGAAQVNRSIVVDEAVRQHLHLAFFDEAIHTPIYFKTRPYSAEFFRRLEEWGQRIPISLDHAFFLDKNTREPVWVVAYRAQRKPRFIPKKLPEPVRKRTPSLAPRGLKPVGH